MEGTPAIYLGKIVSKKNFRAFIYAPNGDRRLVESWEEFEANMQSGVWFATPEDALASIITEANDETTIKVKPKAKAKPKPKAVPEIVQEIDEIEGVLPEDDSVFEVTDENK